MKLIEKKGTTSKILHLFILDSAKSDGSGLTGLVHNSTGLTAYYIREGAAAATAITLVNAIVGTYTSSGFKEVDATNMPGVYELHPPNACLASGADSVVIFLKGAANMAPLPLEIQLDDNTAKDVYDRIGSPAGASISADLVVIDNFVDELEARLTAIRAGYLDNLSVGAVALASVCTDSRLAELDAANLPTDIADIPTVAEFNARTIPTADYFDPAADAVANVTLVATTTTNTDMRGTDNAALAATALTDVMWTDAKAAFIDAAISSRAPANEYDTQMAYIPSDLGDVPTATELIAAHGTGAWTTADLADIPTVAEFNARTLPTADYFDPVADTVANVTLVATTTTNTDMRGTDNAALAATALSDLVWTNAKAALLDAAISGRAPANEYDTQMSYIPTDLADVPTAAELIAAHGTGAWTAADVADIPTVAEFNARSLLAADYTIVADLGVVQTADHTAAIAALQIDLDNPNQYKADVTNLDVAISSRAPANEYDTQMGYVPADLADVPTATELIAAHGTGMWTTADISALATAAALATAQSDIDTIIDEIGGKWELTGNQMIFYKADNLTEIFRFNLFDSDGNPAMTNVSKRERVP